MNYKIGLKKMRNLLGKNLNEFAEICGLHSRQTMHHAEKIEKLEQANLFQLLDWLKRRHIKINGVFADLRMLRNFGEETENEERLLRGFREEQVRQTADDDKYIEEIKQELA